MITFKTIRWKNLLSTGNIFTEIKLNETANALIIGENGSGKSTLLDALMFVLFGKPFRKINKPSLVNSVNEKDCLVEVEFDTNGKEYKVVRGIKPNIFEIYCDGVLLNQDSSSRDYQEHLEKFILKMNSKSLTQIVILGSASFVPFMQLSPGDRRVVIEDLLDIQIFSVMNQIAKQKLQTTKENLDKNRTKIAGKEEKKLFVEKTIQKLKENNIGKLTTLRGNQSVKQMEFLATQEQIASKEKDRDELIQRMANQTALKQKHTKLVSLSSMIEANLKRVEEDHAFFCENDSCPTCRQSIAEEFKIEELKKSEGKMDELRGGITDIKTKIDATLSSLEEIDRVATQLNNIRNDITADRSRLASILSVLNELEDQIKELESADDLLLSNEQELVDVKADLVALEKEKASILEERKYIDVAINLLKDGGIKTKIIKQYLPIMNKLINKYLAQMGFFVNFEINEQFEETIKSRYRDVFSYNNFSEGEKMRIDLALLFTWRAIAKMRNSVNTNLLILDEVFDGSLDGNGTEEFLKIMWSMTSDVNMFVISHKTDAFIDKFQKAYRFEKVKNFSRLVT